jgi:hypothetical protein
MAGWHLDGAHTTTFGETLASPVGLTYLRGHMILHHPLVLTLALARTNAQCQPNSGCCSLELTANIAVDGASGGYAL